MTMSEIRILRQFRPGHANLIRQVPASQQV